MQQFNRNQRDLQETKTQARQNHIKSISSVLSNKKQQQKAHLYKPLFFKVVFITRLLYGSSFMSAGEYPSYSENYFFFLVHIMRKFKFRLFFLLCLERLTNCTSLSLSSVSESICSWRLRSFWEPELVHSSVQGRGRAWEPLGGNRNPSNKLLLLTLFMVFGSY